MYTETKRSIPGRINTKTKMSKNIVDEVGDFLLEELRKLRNCTHEWKEYGWPHRDVRILKCEICGKTKKENTRISKPKQR
jgi:hypothetical protein